MLYPFDLVFALYRSKCEFTIQAVNKQGMWVLSARSQICLWLNIQRFVDIQKYKQKDKKHEENNNQ